MGNCATTGHNSNNDSGGKGYTNTNRGSIVLTNDTDHKRKGTANDFDGVFKLLIVGESNVGKTSICFQYIDGVFDDSMLATIGIDFKMKVVEKDNKRYKIQLWDTAGQERFRTVTSTLYRGVHGVLICFDVTRADSFKELATRWLVEMGKNGVEGCPMVLVGNKTDLVEDGQKAEVSQSDVHQFVQDNAELLSRVCSTLPYYDVSAKTGKNLDAAFEKLIDLVIKNK